MTSEVDKWLKYSTDYILELYKDAKINIDNGEITKC